MFPRDAHWCLAIYAFKRVNCSLYLGLFAKRASEIISLKRRDTTVLLPLSFKDDIISLKYLLTSWSYLVYASVNSDVLALLRTYKREVSFEISSVVVAVVLLELLIVVFANGIVANPLTVEPTVEFKFPFWFLGSGRVHDYYVYGSSKIETYFFIADFAGTKSLLNTFVSSGFKVCYKDDDSILFIAEPGRCTNTRSWDII